MNTSDSNTIQPREVTDALCKEYKALRLTDDQAKAIIANATTRIFINPGQTDTGQDGVST